ncbi:MAG: hypothetical protein AAFW97_05850 [Pseudomonadota bacterium]
MRIAFALAVLAAPLAACDVEQTEEGEMPEIEVEEGNMPEFDVDTADVDVGTTEETVSVPDIDVSTEEEQVQVPTIDIEPADAGDEQ